MHKIKVLWLVNEPIQGCAALLGTPAKTGGGWLAALSQALAHDGKVELGIASCAPGGKAVDLSLEGIQHFTVPASNKGYGQLRPTDYMLYRYQEIVDQFSPDVIHVHGTEWYGGMVTAGNRMGSPTIVSIQGLIGYSRRHLLGDLGFLDILKSRTLQEWLLFSGLWKQKAQWKKRAVVENEIIQGHQRFIGRTLWDRAHLRQINPHAEYFHCNEIVRSEFFEKEWSISTARQHTIFAPSADYPLKGFHVLVKAVAILNNEFPDIQVRVPLAGFAYPSGLKGLYSQIRNGGYANYLNGLIKKLNVNEQIIPLGKLSAQQMADEMQKAHVFALSSFVENSPNTMAEALVVGVPCIVSFAGGIPSLIEDGRDALIFPTGDEAVLADQIRRIFCDIELAIRLSNTSREIARSRHSPEKIVPRMIDIYESVIRKSSSG